MRILASSAALLIALQLASGVARAAFPGANGGFVLTLADVVPEDEEFEGGVFHDVRALSPDGRPDQRFSRRIDRLCKADGECSGGSFSPSGKEFVTVFTSSATGRSRLMLTAADGSRRTFVPGADGVGLSEPAWSPDGRWIAFIQGTERPAIHLISRSGGAARQLTGGWSPAWSARGGIAFSRADGLYVVRPDGSGLRRLRKLGCGDPSCKRRHVSWSPDGRRLAFSDAGNITVIHAERGSLRRLTRGANAYRRDWVPAWSPDGRRVAFARFEEGAFEALELDAIHVVRSTGGRPRLLADREALASLLPEATERDLVTLDWQPSAGRSADAGAVVDGPIALSAARLVIGWIRAALAGWPAR